MPKDLCEKLMATLINTCFLLALVVIITNRNRARLAISLSLGDVMMKTKRNLFLLILFCLPLAIFAMDQYQSSGISDEEAFQRAIAESTRSAAEEEAGRREQEDRRRIGREVPLNVEALEEFIFAIGESECVKNEIMQYGDLQKQSEELAASSSELGDELKKLYTSFSGKSPDTWYIVARNFDVVDRYFRLEQKMVSYHSGHREEIDAGKAMLNGRKFTQTDFTTRRVEDFKLPWGKDSGLKPFLIKWSENHFAKLRRLIGNIERFKEERVLFAERKTREYAAANPFLSGLQVDNFGQLQLSNKFIQEKFKEVISQALLDHFNDVLSPIIKISSGMFESMVSFCRLAVVIIEESLHKDYLATLADDLRFVKQKLSRIPTGSQSGPQAPFKTIQGCRCTDAMLTKRLELLARVVDDTLRRFEPGRDRIVYTSFGSGGALLDYSILNALKHFGYAISSVNLIDSNYRGYHAELAKELGAKFGLQANSTFNAGKDGHVNIYQSAGRYIEDCGRNQLLKASVAVAVDIPVGYGPEVSEGSPGVVYEIMSKNGSARDILIYGLSMIDIKEPRFYKNIAGESGISSENVDALVRTIKDRLRTMQTGEVNGILYRVVREFNTVEGKPLDQYDARRISTFVSSEPFLEFYEKVQRSTVPGCVAYQLNVNIIKTVLEDQNSFFEQLNQESIDVESSQERLQSSELNKFYNISFCAPQYPLLHGFELIR